MEEKLTAILKRLDVIEKRLAEAFPTRAAMEREVNAWEKVAEAYWSFKKATPSEINHL